MGGLLQNILLRFGGLVLQSPTLSSPLTALVGGGQPGATALNDTYNEIGTVASSGDSVILPPIVQKQVKVWVINNGANPCNVFPQPGGAINALSANTAYSAVNGHAVLFFSTGNGNWKTVFKFAIS